MNSNLRVLRNEIIKQNVCFWQTVYETVKTCNTSWKAERKVTTEPFNDINSVLTCTFMYSYFIPQIQYCSIVIVQLFNKTPRFVPHDNVIFRGVASPVPKCRSERVILNLSHATFRESYTH